MGGHSKPSVDHTTSSQHIQERAFPDLEVVLRSSSAFTLAACGEAITSLLLFPFRWQLLDFDVGRRSLPYPFVPILGSLFCAEGREAAALHSVKPSRHTYVPVSPVKREHLQQKLAHDGGLVGFVLELECHAYSIV